MAAPRGSLLLLLLGALLCTALGAAEEVLQQRRKKEIGLAAAVEDAESALRRMVAEKANTLCQGSPDDPPPENMLPRYRIGSQTVSKLAAWESDSSATVTLKSSSDGPYLEVTGRTSDADGPVLKFDKLVAGNYKISGWVKLGGEGQSPVRVTVDSPEDEDRPRTAATGVGKAQCWTRLEGGFTVVSRRDVSLRLEGPPQDRSLMLSSFALTPVVDAKWKKQQNIRINQFRKRDVLVRIKLKSGQPAVRAWAVIDQKVSDFPFGAAVSGGFAKSPEWQKWHGKRFTWSVLENEMKWYVNERWKGDVNFKDADDTMAVLQSMGQNVRGHCIFWDDVSYVQQWVQRLGKADLMAAVQGRLDSVVKRFKGRVRHWDVNNELLHGSFYETRFNRSINSWMFRVAKALDPKVQTVFNDYNLIEEYRDKNANGEIAVQAVRELQAYGADVDIIGTQSHFRSIPNGARIKAELDILQTAGLPVWITELDIWQSDPLLQANYFEVVMREAFSHPAVQGIMQWEVARPPCKVWASVDASKCVTECTTCFVDSNWNDRPIGERFVRLRKEWSSHLKVYSSTNGSIRFRGFFGRYRARITYKKKNFELWFDVPKGTDLSQITLTLPM